MMDRSGEGVGGRQFMETRRNMRAEEHSQFRISDNVTDLYVESNRVLNFTVARFRNPIQLHHFLPDVESLHKKLFSI